MYWTATCFHSSSFLTEDPTYTGGALFISRFTNFPYLKPNARHDELGVNELVRTDAIRETRGLKPSKGGVV